MRLVIRRLADEGLEFVVDAAGLARVARRRLQRDAGRAVRRQLEEERVRILAQLLDETLLERPSMYQIRTGLSLHWSVWTIIAIAFLSKHYA